jgi:hypothetical protein
MAKKALIPEALKKKQSELFDIDGTLFRVNFLPKAGLNRLEEWVEKLAKSDARATTMEYATEIHHTGKLPTEFVDPEEAVSRYVDFIKVCTLYLNREMMEKAIRSAQKKKDGTLTGRRVQHLAFAGLAVNFGFYELCAVNETDNVMVLEIRSSDCSSKVMSAFESCKTCAEILEENSHLPTVAIDKTAIQIVHKVDIASVVPEDINQQFTLDMDDEGFTILKYKGYESRVEIPSYIVGKPVIRIGEGAFSHKDRVTEIVIPNTVKRIEGAAFDCTGLTSVTIPEGVVSLGAMAFSWCDKLAAIVLPDSMTEIGMNAFGGCNALTEITIPTGLKELPGNLFSFCTNLKKVIIPDSIQKISNWTFAGCNNVVLYGTKDSYAETFANANGLEFQEI